MLEVKNLRTFYFTEKGVLKAVDGINLSLEKGEVLGLTGESGCGKSTIMLSIINLVPSPGRIVGGEVLFDGKNLVKKSDKEMRKIRWKRISLVFQEAMGAFDPLYTIGDQILEAINYHQKISKEESIKRVGNLLEMVGIDGARGKDYPYEFSGGMLQRALIAMALACNPDVMILDEPTTGLDVITQAKLLRDLEKLQDKMKLSMILVTHDLALINALCQKVAVMYAGKIIEYSDAPGFFKKPIHPYSQLLRRSFPSLHSQKKRLNGILGAPPDLLNPPSGCRFHKRCPLARKVCLQEVPLLEEVLKNHKVSCHFSKKILQNELSL